MNQVKRKLSPISTLHYVKLTYRSTLFVLAAIIYAFSKLQNRHESVGLDVSACILLTVIWAVYAVEIVLRFFPARLESMGCQKQFKRNFKSTNETTPKLHSWKRTFEVAAAWLALNGVIGLLYFTHIIDKGILLLISLAYGVCDMICILFFCPFQTWFMKNRCCTDCRIYNWDFAMMFTPFVFVPSAYTWSLLALSLILLLRWEITLRRHPERFSVSTNACISCAECREKLCHHKKQLHSFWEKNKSRIKRVLPEKSGRQ